MTRKRMTSFKVWIEIERYDQKTGSGRTMNAPGSSLAAFNTYRQAWDYAARVPQLAASCPDLLDAAELDIARWEKGDLTEAVRLLDKAVREGRAA